MLVRLEEVNGTSADEPTARTLHAFHAAAGGPSARGRHAPDLGAVPDEGGAGQEVIAVLSAYATRVLQVAPTAKGGAA